MTRTVLTQMVKAKGGRITGRDGKNFVGYAVPMNEAAFCDFREAIPYLNMWYREEDGYQLFGVWFDQLMEEVA